MALGKAFTSLIACTTADAAISLQRPECSREPPLLPGSITVSRSKKAKPGCPPVPSLPSLILKIKTSFHLSQSQERRRQKEVCCKYMKLSLSEGEKKSGGEGEVEQGRGQNRIFTSGGQPAD